MRLASSERWIPFLVLYLKGRTHWVRLFRSILIPETCKCCLVWQKHTADVMKLHILWWGDCLDYSGGTFKYNHIYSSERQAGRDLTTDKKKSMWWKQSQRKMLQHWLRRWKKKPWAKEYKECSSSCWKWQGNRKDKEMGSSLQPLERVWPCQCLDFG